MGEKVLTHEELRDSRKGLQILVREKLKLKKARQFARSCRGDSQDSDDAPFPFDDDNNSELLGDLAGNGDEDNSEQSKGKAGASTNTIVKKEKQFKSLLPATSFDQLAILVHFVNKADPNFAFLSPSKSDSINAPEFSMSEITSRFYKV